MKQRKRLHFIHCIATWLFISALQVLLAIFAYGIITTIITQIHAPIFVNYIGTGAVILGYITLEVLAFISFVIEG